MLHFATGTNNQITITNVPSRHHREIRLQSGPSDLTESVYANADFTTGYTLDDANDVEDRMRRRAADPAGLLGLPRESVNSPSR
jgi:hypothetical protein